MHCPSSLRLPYITAYDIRLIETHRDRFVKPCPQVITSAHRVKSFRIIQEPFPYFPLHLRRHLQQLFRCPPLSHQYTHIFFNSRSGRIELAKFYIYDFFCLHIWNIFSSIHFNFDILLSIHIHINIYNRSYFIDKFNKSRLKRYSWYLVLRDPDNKLNINI